MFRHIVKIIDTTIRGEWVEMLNVDQLLPAFVVLFGMFVGVTILLNYRQRKLPFFRRYLRKYRKYYKG